MESTKYFCSDCETTFDGDEFTSDCSNCGSSNIKEVGGGKRFIVPKPVQYALGAILFLILIMNFCGESNNNSSSSVALNLKYAVNLSEFDENDKSISIDIIQIDDQNKRVKRNDLIKFFNFKTVNSIPDNDFNLRVFTSGKKASAKIYPCASGSIEISWNPPTSYKLNSPQKRKIYKKIIFDFPNSKADCKMKPLEFEAILDSKKGECYKLVSFNYNKDVWISINGKEGPYTKDKFEFNFRNYDEYNLWAFHTYPGQSKIDTIAYVQNKSNIIKGLTCKSCIDRLPTLTSKFESTMKEWLVNPRDKKLRSSLLKMISKTQKSFTLDNKLYNFEEFYDDISDNFQTTVYRLDPKSIKFNKNLCQVKSFKVYIVH